MQSAISAEAPLTLAGSETQVACQGCLPHCGNRSAPRLTAVPAPRHWPVERQDSTKHPPTLRKNLSALTSNQLTFISDWEGWHDVRIRHLH